MYSVNEQGNGRFWVTWNFKYVVLAFTLISCSLGVLYWTDLCWGESSRQGKQKVIKEICVKEIRIFQSYKHILKILNGFGPHIESIHMHMLYMLHVHICTFCSFEEHSERRHLFMYEYLQYLIQWLKCIRYSVKKWFFKKMNW